MLSLLLVKYDNKVGSFDWWMMDCSWVVWKMVVFFFFDSFGVVGFDFFGFVILDGLVVGVFGFG